MKIADITQTENISIGILIGGNCSKNCSNSLEPGKVILSQNGSPQVDQLGQVKMMSLRHGTELQCTYKAIVLHYLAVEAKVKDTGIEHMLHCQQISDVRS